MTELFKRLDENKWTINSGIPSQINCAWKYALKVLIWD